MRWCVYAVVVAATCVDAFRVTRALPNPSTSSAHASGGRHASAQ